MAQQVRYRPVSLSYEELRDPEWHRLVHQINAAPAGVRERFHELAEVGEMPVKQAARRALLEAAKDADA